jgi:uncharacterized protein (TIGR02271 family)
MNGLEGTVAPDQSLSNDTTQPLLVRFHNGKELFVPRELLKMQADGRYHLMARIDDLMATQGSTLQTETNDAQTLVVPVTEEVVTVQKRVVESGRVEIRKSVHERTEIIDQPLQMEEVEIERVAVNRVIDEAVPVRYEGDTTIISLLEEVLVVEKRLVLREEIHIKKLRKEVHNPQEVLLREEQVEIVRTAGNDPHYQPDKAQDQ